VSRERKIQRGFAECFVLQRQLGLTKVDLRARSILLHAVSLHENLALTIFDSHQRCDKVALLSLTGESKVLEHI